MKKQPLSPLSHLYCSHSLLQPTVSLPIKTQSLFSSNPILAPNIFKDIIKTVRKWGKNNTILQSCYAYCADPRCSFRPKRAGVYNCKRSLSLHAKTRFSWGPAVECLGGNSSFLCLGTRHTEIKLDISPLKAIESMGTSLFTFNFSLYRSCLQRCFAPTSSGILHLYTFATTVSQNTQ